MPVVSLSRRIVRTVLCSGLLGVGATPSPVLAAPEQAADKAIRTVVEVALRRAQPAMPLAGLNLTSLSQPGIHGEKSPAKDAEKDGQKDDEPPVLTSANARQIGKLLKDAGFRDYEIDKDGDIVVRMQGYKVLLLVGTNKNSWLLFKFAFSGTHIRLTALNEWNRHVKYSRAYLNKDGDVILESDQDLTGGVTPERIKTFIKSFDLLLVDFIKFIKRQRED